MNAFYSIFMIWQLTLCYTDLAVAQRLSPPIHHQERYHAMEIGPLPGIPKRSQGGLIGEALNDSGKVLGWTAFIDTHRNQIAKSFLWQNNQWQSISVLLPSALNNDSQVVGTSPDPHSKDGKAVVWQKGKLHFLKNFPGNDDQSRAFGINNNGQIVGWSSQGENAHAALWDKNTLIDIGVLSNCTESAGHAVNGRGQVVGSSTAKDGRMSYACLWQDGEIRQLGSLVEANAINNKGQIAGNRMPDGGHDTSKSLWQIACLWEDGKVRDLGSISGCDYSESHAINERGQIVGKSHRVVGKWRAFLWQDGKMINLNRLVTLPVGVVLTDAIGINNSGQILCEGESQSRDYLLLLSPTL